VDRAAAQADSPGAPAYTREDIIRHFTPNLGASRGICIGTETECPTAAPTGANVGFDLIVTFQYDSNALTPAARRNLDEFVGAMRSEQLRRAAFLVEGHTDAKGSDDYNLQLSKRRAEAVVAYLALRGIDPSRLVVKGYGEMKPRTDNPYDGANRRVETRIDTMHSAAIRP
jgi:outer membrane protein OmpA-like peptidoglycan-associated protein